jgi:molybdopterin synthase catalytic subunit
MCNLTNAMVEQTGSVKQMTQNEMLEIIFYEEQQEFFEKYFKDLQDSMNEHYKEMEEVENAI